MERARVVRRGEVALALVIPTVIGVAGVVGTRVMTQNESGDLDTGDRAFQLLLTLLLPFACYATSALTAWIWNLRRDITPRGLLASALVGSLGTVLAWLALGARG